jgi:outer membrane protein assembly factor BamB
MNGLRYLITLTLCCTSTAAMAENWSGFRGAAGTGVSAESNLPLKWSMDKNVAWKIDLPGRGESSPAVNSKRLFVTSQTEDEALWVIAIDRDSGKIAWKKNVGGGELAADGPQELYTHQHNPATSCPSADEEHVWAYFGTGLLVCLDVDGNEVWRRDLVKEYGPYEIRFGMASSPRLWGDLLYVACMTKGPSYVVALDKKTGNEVWKTDRKLPAVDDGPDSYSTPIVLQTPDGNQLVVAGADHINAYDLVSGEQIWISGGLKVNSEYGRIIASPVVSEEVVVQCASNPGKGGIGRAIAIKTGGSGDITESHRMWTFPRESSDITTPTAYEGKLYMVREIGIGICIDLQTGAVHYRKRLGDSAYRASVLAGDGKVYCLSKNGLCTVLKTGTEGEILAKNQLDGEFLATPAIADGTIYFRGNHRMYAVGSPRIATKP